MFRDDSAASSMLAVILMMGFVAATAVSLFVVGTATLEQTRDDAQQEQVENTFRQLNKEVSSVAFGREKYRSMQFEIEDDRAAFQKQNTGQIQVIVDGTVEVDRSVGSLVYESEGTKLAYQAGGIWKGTGKNSRLVSEPPVTYSQGSLSFPIPVLVGDENIKSGELDITKKRTVAPINDDGYIQGKLVTLKITSKYYMGWAEYFRQQTNDVAVSVDHSPAGPKGTVTVKLGKPVANGNFENGVMATGGDDGDIKITTGSATIDGPVSATGDIIDNTGAGGGYTDPNPEENVDSNLYELDRAIQRKVNDAETNASVVDEQIDGGDTLTGGTTYYDDDGFTLTNGENVDVDLSTGNVTLIVDGNMTLDGGNINVEDGGTDHALRIYSTGDFGMKNSFAGDTDRSSAKHLQIYGTSTMLVGITGGSTEFIGTVYAPREEEVLADGEENTAVINGGGGGGGHPGGGGGGPPGGGGGGGSDKCDGWDVCIVKGNSAVTGAIVAGPTKVAQSANIEYDNSLADIEPSLQLDGGVLPPKITFIKVAVHEIAVNNSDAQNLEPAGGLAPSASAMGVGSGGSSASSAALRADAATPRYAAAATRVAPPAA